MKIHDFAKDTENASDNQTAATPRQSLASLAAAAFFAGAMALVNPAIAGECDATTELVRSAARDKDLSSDLMAKVEVALERALDRQADGDDAGCLSELSVARRILEG
ncbi:MAG: hypothetical protein R3D29_09535 [Nitratireductor sp.]